MSSGSRGGSRFGWRARFVLGCLLVVVLGAVWFASRAFTVVTAVQAGQEQVGLTRQAYTDRDLARAAEHISAARAQFARARRASADPTWVLAGAVPVVGDEVRAVGSVADSTADLLDAAAPVARQVGEAGTDPAALRALALDGSLAPGLADLHQEAVTSQAVARGLEDDSLHPAVAERVESFGGAVGQVEPLLGSVATYSALLPRLLGSDEPQDLMVVVQTPSEVRSLGGLAGLVLQVRAEAGRLSVQQTYSGSAVPAAPEPVLDSSALREHYDVYGDRAGRYLVNATMIPDTTLAGPLLAGWHERHTGLVPDHVVVVDLTVLSGLLGVTGAVDLPDGAQVSADDADELFGYGIYTRIADPAEQDAYFAAAAAAVFGALTGPDTDPTALAAVLADAARTDRLSVWSGVPATQDLVVSAGLDGDLLRDPQAVGVFLNDGTGAKLQYFLDVQADGPDPGGTVTVALTSRVADPASLPDYVAGQFDQLGVTRGTQRVQVAVYGAVGSGPTAWREDGETVAVGAASVDGRGVGVRSVDIAPGETVLLEVDLAGPPAQGPSDWSLSVTPGVLEVTRE